MGYSGKNNKCSQCGCVISDNSSGFCTECGATLLSRKTKKTVICHAVRGADLVRLVFVVILLIAACFYSVWNLKHVKEYQASVEPDYLTAQQMLEADGEIDPEFQMAYKHYGLAEIYLAYAVPVMVGASALTAVFALMCIVRLRFSYAVTAALNIAGLVLLCADTLCLFLYSVPMNYIYAATAFLVRFLLIFVLAKYVHLAQSESSRRRKRKKGDIDIEGTKDMYDTSMFTSDMKTLKRKVEREGQADFELKNNAGEIGEVTLISKGTPPPKAVEEKQAPAVPVAVAQPKKTNDRFGDERNLDAVQQLAAVISELEGSSAPAPVEEVTPAPAPVEEAKPAPAPVEESKPAPAPVEEAKPAPAPVEEAKPAPAPVEEANPAPAPVEEAKLTPAPVGEAKPTPAPVEEATPAPVPVENTEESASKTAKLGGILKKLSLGKKDEEEFFDEEQGITDCEPIPLVAAAPAEESEPTEEESQLNRKAGPWQCPQCGQMNYASSTSCMSCGISR